MISVCYLAYRVDDAIAKLNRDLGRHVACLSSSDSLERDWVFRDMALDTKPSLRICPYFMLQLSEDGV